MDGCFMLLDFGDKLPLQVLLTENQFVLSGDRFSAPILIFNPNLRTGCWFAFVSRYASFSAHFLTFLFRKVHSPISRPSA